MLRTRCAPLYPAEIANGDGPSRNCDAGFEPPKSHTAAQKSNDSGASTPLPRGLEWSSAAPAARVERAVLDLAIAGSDDLDVAIAETFIGREGSEK